MNLLRMLKVTVTRPKFSGAVTIPAPKGLGGGKKPLMLIKWAI